MQGWPASSLLCSSVIVAGVLEWAPLPARAESLEQIQGLSVVASFKSQFTFYQAGLSRRGGNIEGLLRIYISKKGNVFEHGEAVVSPNNASSVRLGGKLRVFAMDKWEPVGRSPQTVEWTMMDGHLGRILKLIRGELVTTIAIDPARLSCTFDRQYHPDPQTGTIITNTTGQPVQIESYKVASYTCEVKKGNIFASVAAD